MKNLLLLSLVILLFACKKDDDPQPLNAPVATAASDITNNGFTANWNPSDGANDYELDVATDNSFNNIVETLKNLAPSSVVIDSLDDNTEYFYRVRATLNGGNLSSNSNVIIAITLPDAPVAADATNMTNSSFTANWNAVDGVTDYLLYVSLENFPADPPNNLPDYNGKEVTGTSHDVIGLNSETIYYYVVKAKVDGRISNSSNAIMTQTTIDFRDGYVGDYTCLQMYYYFDPIGDTVLNWSMDTVSLNYQIIIQKIADSSLNVIMGNYSYEARYEGDQNFICIDCNGPPDYVRFYAIDSINSYQKSGVLNWYRFIGKKNHLEN